jgi:hypothetical protein
MPSSRTHLADGTITRDNALYQRIDQFLSMEVKATPAK